MYPDHPLAQAPLACSKSQSSVVSSINSQSASKSFGITLFGIGSKYINKGHFIYYFFINTARGFPST